MGICEEVGVQMIIICVLKDKVLPAPGQSSKTN